MKSGLGLCGSAAAQSRLSCSAQQRHSSTLVTLPSLLLRFNPLKLELTANPPLLCTSWVLGIWESQWIEVPGAEQSAEFPQNLGGRGGGTLNLRDHAPALCPKCPCSLAQAISCYLFTGVLNLVFPNSGCQQPNPFILGVQQKLFFELLNTERWASRTHPCTMYQTVTSQPHIGVTTGERCQDRNERTWLCQFVGATSPMKDSLVADWEQCEAR